MIYVFLYIFLIAVTIESLKLLCNLLFNSVKVQQSKVLISSLPYLIDRVKNYTTNVPYNVKLFDMRILFLLTALNISTRDIVRTDLYGDICLIKIIEEFVTQNCDNKTTVIKVKKFITYCKFIHIYADIYLYIHIHIYI